MSEQIISTWDPISEPKCPHGWSFHYKSTINAIGTAGCPQHCVRIPPQTVGAGLDINNEWDLNKETIY